MPMLPAIGALNKRLTLIGVDRVSDGAGGYVRADGEEAEVWAQIRPASANERQQAEKLGQVISHVVTVRHRSDLLPVRGMRGKWIDHAGRAREITFETAHDPDERGRFLVLTGREGDPK